MATQTRYFSELEKTLLEQMREYPSELGYGLNAIAEDPTNMDLRLVVSDEAEEKGFSHLAECLRWMAREGKFPHEEPDEPKYWSWWWSTTTRQCGPKPISSVLPTDNEKEWFEVCTGNYFETCRLAEEAFYRDWQKARKEGWNPDNPPG